MDSYNPNFYRELQDDSAMIQAAVDAATNGEKVTIPRLNERTNSNIWVITKAIKLHSGSVICLDNCHLRQADGVFENMFVNSNLGTADGCTREGRQYDIRIFGLGNAVLDGGNHNGLTEETQKKNGLPSIYLNSMFFFVNTERVTIENIRILKQRYWAIVFHYSSHGRISNIDFDAPRTVINQDGIDLRTGCSQFLIENITGCTGDDTVALTCLKSLYDEEMSAASMESSIHHVIIRNIQTCTPCSLVRLLNHGGKLIYNIVIENIMEVSESDSAHRISAESIPLNPETEKMRSGACVRIGENFYYKNSVKAEKDETFNITVRNVVAHARTAVRVSCALSGALFENIQLYGNGGTAVYFGEGSVKNITVRDITYPLCFAPCATDDNCIENHFNQQANPQINKDRQLCAVFFKDTEAEGLLFQNIFAGDGLTSVFGGSGSIEIKAENILKNCPNIPLISETLQHKLLKTYSINI